MTTPNNDVKYVKNIAKEAAGLTETEINELETVTEEDLNNYPGMEVIKPIIPEVPPTVEEIEQMEKVDIEEVKADANFPSNEGATTSGVGSEDRISEGDIEAGSSIEVSEDSEIDLEDSELDEALKVFDNITITVEDIKHQQAESEDFRLIELPNDCYEEFIELYNKLQDEPNLDVLDNLSENTKIKLLPQFKKLGVNTNNLVEYKYMIESYIREICGNAYMDNGKDTLDEAMKKLSDSKESKEMSDLLEDFIEKSYNERIERLNKLIDDKSASREIVESCIEALNANEDAKTFDFISRALSKKPSYLNSWKAFKHQKRNADHIHSSLSRIGIANAKVDIIVAAIDEFTSLTVETVDIFSIILEVIVKETNFSNKIQLMRIYSMLLYLSGAIHVSKANKVLNEFYTGISTDFRKVCEAISAGYKAYDLGKESCNAPKSSNNKKRRK